MPEDGVTEILRRLAQGDKDAESELLIRVYRELHGMARAHLLGERPGHTLQATALVHEVYLRLIPAADIDWKSRSQFFAIAGNTMRRILVDYGRQRRAGKRGGPHDVFVSLDQALLISPEQCDLVDDLDHALERLKVLHPRWVKVVELRFFAGLSEEDIAQILSVSVRTVKRDWEKARAWLNDELSP